ncbi:MAG: Ig-like domain-containing protein [Prolixibacteraceae bacterium]|nr:Ig-like domain-containing protein [Prolixibacteraceae bacterium]
MEKSKEKNACFYIKPCNTLKAFLTFSLLIFVLNGIQATKLVEVKVVDKDYLQVFFKDGDVVFVDDGLGPDAYTATHQTDNNYVVSYGPAINTGNATTTGSWLLKSSDDPEYGETGLNPDNCYRKSKLNGLAEMDWAGSDWSYEYTMEHTIILELPKSMTNGKTYTLEINSNTNSDSTTCTFTYDIFQSRTEAIHINLIGYSTEESIKPADLYMWMGNGAARDYSGFEGNTVYIYDVNSGLSYPVGTVNLYTNKASEAYGRYMIQSDVWKADFSGFNTPGTYRLAIEGIGCSNDFEIKSDIYFEPFKVSTLGFYYMRIGEDRLDMYPVPRRPLYLPGVSPSTTKVVITDVDPYDSEWGSYSGDNWDSPSWFSNYIKPGSPENPNAWGGHSDALDWDRHLGHVPIIYDMLLPYFLTGGALFSDELGIGESGNGIPDIIDEARNEVDFWLRLRYQGGYSHGLSNPNSSNVLYQADNTPVAAWANAANAAMLAEAFRLASMPGLMEEYRDSAINAYNYASSLSNQMLDQHCSAGLRGRDLKMTAAAFLYNITGNTDYEDVVNNESLVSNSTSDFFKADQYNQLYAMAAYLKTPQTVHYPTLQSNMKEAAVYQAMLREANNSETRPSRRSSDADYGWFHTEIHVHRSILAHAVTSDAADKAFLENALVLEAGWSLGRNSANVIQMTTATTSLENKKSAMQAYTSGWDDGAPGVHPGHTPYWNLHDWGSGMIMGRPTWLSDKGYPDIDDWPVSEAYYDVRYVYAHTEFTPQQTMRGKQALYGYLAAIGEPPAPPVSVTGITLSPTALILNGTETQQITATVEPENATNKFLIWQNNDDDVATISIDGKVTGVGVGSTIIVATTADGGFKDTCEITVNNVAVTGVSVSPTAATIKESEVETLTATIIPENAIQKGVSWETSDPLIATVNTNGMVTGISPGTATITATSNEGDFNATCTITVEQLPDQLIVYSDIENIVNGTWTGTGTLSELSSGGFEGSEQYRYDYSLLEWWDGMGMYFDPVDASQYENLNIAINGPTTSNNYIYIQLFDEDENSSETYSFERTTAYEQFSVPLEDLIGDTSFDPSQTTQIMIAVSGTSSGSGTFYFDYIYFGDPVEVIPVTGVTVSPLTGTIDGGTLQLTATVLPEDATNKEVSWSSDNPSIATVNRTGMVMGNAIGTATITATTSDGGFTASSEITVVTPTEGRIIKVMPLGNSITQGDGRAALYLVPGGYRLPLWENLVDAGLDCGVDFVGSLTTNPATGLPDPDHEGHSGWTTGMILDNIDAYMASANPDIVMMHLGTNDVAQDVVDDAPANLRALMDHICAALPPDGKLYVAKIIPMGGVGNASSIAYNSLIVDAVTEKQGEGLPVHLVDAYGMWQNEYYDAWGQSNCDWTHPGQLGYNALGDFWFDVIKDDVQLPCTTDIPVTGVTVNPESTRIKVDSTHQLSAIISPENATNQEVNWNSSNTLVATVSPGGFVTGLSAGTATITATTVDGNFTGTSVITVSEVATNLNVTDITLYHGDIECFDAEQVITVAGNETTVTIENGATAAFIAGQSILFLPGTHIQEGATASATITTDQTFCSENEAEYIVEYLPSEKNNTVDKNQNEETGDLQKDVKVYPNPCTGRFTVELINIEKNASAVIYNTVGNAVLRKTLNSAVSNTINLNHSPKGIYFIKTLSGKKQIVNKIIVI